MKRFTRYFFVAAPVEQVRATWLGFQSQGDGSNGRTRGSRKVRVPRRMSGSVAHFIPAQGGCFFVLASTRPGVRLPLSLRPAAVDRLNEEFRPLLSGLVPPSGGAAAPAEARV